MGLIMIGAMFLYLLLAIVVVMLAIRYARTRGKSARRWGLSAVLIMYLIPFWDWVPTVVVHKYYCEKEAGFWVYKTVDEWKVKNPGVMERLVVNEDLPFARRGDMKNYTDTYFVNQRINLIVKRNGQFLFNRWRHEREVVDTRTNTILARYVDFSTSQERPQAGWSGWKFWLYSKYCTDNGGQLNKFGDFYLQFKGEVR